jgi:3-oxoacyl-[acyl-carrier-protein] synthase-3
MVQAGLGMTGGFAFDVQAVCAGFVYALANANALILSGQADRVLVIGAETFSRIMDWTDRSTCVLFGDGAGALLLEAQEGDGTRTTAASCHRPELRRAASRDPLCGRRGLDPVGTGCPAHAGQGGLPPRRRKACANRATALDKAGLTAAMSTGSCRIRRTCGSSRHRAEDGRADGPRRRHRAGPRQHLGRVDPAGAVGRVGAARSSPATCW